MKRFWGIVRYEYRMSTHRWSLWVVLGLLAAFYVFSSIPVDAEEVNTLTNNDLLTNAGLLGFQINLFMPVVGGILVSDRLWRDQRLGVKETLDSTGLNRWTYILGKYFGSLFSILTPVFLMSVILGAVNIIFGTPPVFFPMVMLSFLAINVPAFAFITIFSLACPLIMPLRVYQVLFTGYWFWGNFLNPEVFPTLSGTLLTPGGKYAMEGFFGTTFGNLPPIYTAGDAVLNLLVLAGCIVAAMITLERYLAWKAHRS